MKHFNIFSIIVAASLFMASCTKSPDTNETFYELDVVPVQLFILMYDANGNNLLDSSYVANNSFTAKFRNQIYDLKLDVATKYISSVFKGFIYTTHPITSQKVLYFGELSGVETIDNENLTILCNNKPNIITINNKIIKNKDGMPELERSFTYNGKKYMGWQEIILTE